MSQTTVTLERLYEVSRMLLRLDMWRSSNFNLDRKPVNSFGQGVLNTRSYRRSGGKSQTTDLTPLQENVKYLNDNIPSIQSYMNTAKMQKARKHLKVFQNTKPLGEQLLDFSKGGNDFFEETIEWFINVKLRLYRCRVSVSLTPTTVEIHDNGQDLIFEFPYDSLPLGEELLNRVKTVLMVGK